jgi:hypothetical protein
MGRHCPASRTKARTEPVPACAGATRTSTRDMLSARANRIFETAARNVRRVNLFKLVRASTRANRQVICRLYESLPGASTPLLSSRDKRTRVQLRTAHSARNRALCDRHRRCTCMAADSHVRDQTMNDVRSDGCRIHRDLPTAARPDRIKNERHMRPGRGETGTRSRTIGMRGSIMAA